jgi:polyhydroxybutyrate depolymerase
MLIESRPYRSVIPTSYDGSKAYPLLVLLHGFTGTGENNDKFFGMSAAIEKRGVLLVTPQGTRNALGISFWNATDACCDYGNSKVDDVTYLNAVVNDMSVRYRVDPKRIYFAGHSNGGFMTYRMACDKGDRLAAIVSFSGAMYDDTTKCTAASSVAALQIHSTTDETISFNGGTLLNGGRYPSASTSIGFWAKRNGCSDMLAPGEMPADFIESLSGNETKKQTFASCPAGLSTAFWTITGAVHTPKLKSNFAEDVLDFLLSHSRP